MANTKISALTSATTPLAGTEVLPIVQSSATVKVATNDLTVRNVRANATTGILQITGPAAASTRVATVPDANFTVARTDAAQSFTGDQTLSTGNLIIGTSGKGIDFSATPGTGTSELFADYEEGTWSPTYVTTGGSFTYANQFGSYTKTGRLVTVNFYMYTSAATVGTGSVKIGGLPFTPSASTNVRGGSGVGRATLFSINTPCAIQVSESAITLQYQALANGAFADLSASDLSTGAVANELAATFSYFV
jgi:hypothetical protein